MSAFTTRPNWIRVLVHGLFVCAFKQEGDKPPILEIAALKNPTPSHKLKLTLFDRDLLQGGHSIAISQSDFVQLEISDAAGVIRYQQSAEFNFESTDDRRDFRWLIDFENELFNSECESRNTGFKFKVNEGLAYTMIRSVPLHRSINDGKPEDWRRVALVMAVDIDYRPGRAARLNTPQGAIELDPLRRHNLVLRNDCEGAPCGQAEAGTDLNELFQAVVKPPQSPDYKIIKPRLPEWIEDLILDQEILETGGIDGPAAKQLRGLTTIFNPTGNHDTSRHPCGPAYLGKSNGLS